MLKSFQSSKVLKAFPVQLYSFRPQKREGCYWPSVSHPVKGKLENLSPLSSFSCFPFGSLLGQPAFSLLQPGDPTPRSQPINLNHYATKKSVAESMLDVALFMSNATRLKAVLEQGPASHYYTTLVTLISISLLLQVAIGILLVVIGEEPWPGVGLGAL